MSEITCAEAAARLARGEPTHLLDVRQPWEHELSALPGSQLIPLGELAARLDEVPRDPDALLLVYCHHGVRSLHAVALLARAGVAAVSLAGGIDRFSTEIDPSIARY